MHNIQDADQGFTVREPAWHGLFPVFDEYPGREEAMRAAGHDFEIVEREVQTIPLIENGRHIKAEGWKALLHGKTGQVIHMARNSYNVWQPSILWDVADALADEPELQYETAGSMGNLTTMWVLVKLREPFELPGQSIAHSYLHLYTSHDGSAAFTGQSMNVVVVCQNTHVAANNAADEAGTQYKFSHRAAPIEDRIAEAKEVVRGLRIGRQSFIDLANELADIKVSTDDVKEFLRRFLPDPPAAVQTDRADRFIAEARNSVWEIVNESPTVPDNQRRTAYGLWQAGVEYLDHLRAFRTPETYFKRTVRPNPAKAQLAKLVSSLNA